MESAEEFTLAKIAYGDARLRFQTGGIDPLGPILAAFVAVREDERARCEAVLQAALETARSGAGRPLKSRTMSKGRKFPHL